MEQQRPEQDSSVGDALALALRCARFCWASLIHKAGFKPHKPTHPNLQTVALLMALCAFLLGFTDP